MYLGLTLAYPRIIYKLHSNRNYCSFFHSSFCDLSSTVRKFVDHMVWIKIPKLSLQARCTCHHYIWRNVLLSLLDLTGVPEVPYCEGCRQRILFLAGFLASNDIESFPIFVFHSISGFSKFFSLVSTFLIIFFFIQLSTQARFKVSLNCPICSGSSL